MARPLRIAAPGTTHHVMARGNARMAIYLDDRDRLNFLDLLGEVVDTYQLACDAYCLMPNHYHLLLETTNHRLSAAIRQLNGVYAQWWNRRHERVGHVFQGRFKAQLVQDRPYYLHVARYILRNPVRSGLVSHPSAYRWSSIGAMTDTASRPAWLRVDKLMTTAELPCGTDFVRFLGDGPDREDVAAAIAGDARIIGDRDFVRSVGRQLRSSPSPEVPVRDRCAARPSLRELFPSTWESGRARDEAMWRAHARHGYSQAAIADFLGLHYTTVSRRLAARRLTVAGAASAPAPGTAPTQSSGGSRVGHPPENAKSKDLTPWSTGGATCAPRAPSSPPIPRVPR